MARPGRPALRGTGSCRARVRRRTGDRGPRTRAARRDRADTGRDGRVLVEPLARHNPSTGVGRVVRHSRDRGARARPRGPRPGRGRPRRPARLRGHEGALRPFLSAHGDRIVSLLVIGALTTAIYGALATYAGARTWSSVTSEAWQAQAASALSLSVVLESPSAGAGPLDIDTPGWS